MLRRGLSRQQGENVTIFSKVLLLGPVAKQQCLLFFVQHSVTKRIELFWFISAQIVHKLTDWNFQELCFEGGFPIKDFWNFYNTRS